MSSTNLDLVRSIYAASWERGDYSSAEWAHPEIEFSLADGPDPGTWTGLAELAEGWRAFASAWEDLRPDPTEFRELDDEHVLVLVHFLGRSKAGGMELAQMRTKQASLLQVRDAKVTRLVLYWDYKRAFADLGLTPDTGT